MRKTDAPGARAQPRARATTSADTTIQTRKSARAREAEPAKKPAEALAPDGAAIEAWQRYGDDGPVKAPKTAKKEGVSSASVRTGGLGMLEVPKSKALTAEEPGVLFTEGNFGAHAKAILGLFDSKAAVAPLMQARWAPLREITTAEDIKKVHDLFKEFDPPRAEEHFVRFWNAAAHARATQPAEIKQLLEKVPADWLQKAAPYEMYVDNLGVPEGKDKAGFGDTKEMFEYMKWLGVDTLSLRPVFESPGWDGGYDISKFTPAEDLGGAAGYEDMVKAGLKEGIYSVWDLVINHISIEHPWYQKLVEGDESMLDRFITYDGVEVVKEEVRDGGDKWIQYRYPDGTLEEQQLIFPETCENHLAEVEVKGEKHQLFRTFNKFQFDINPRNPDVMEWMLQLIGNHLNAGTLGLRLDALRHVMKRKGVPAHDLEETQVLQELMKRFVKHVSPKAVILPEVVAGSSKAIDYYGEKTTIAGQKTTSGADAMYDFDRRGVLQHMLFFQKTDDFWSKIHKYPDPPEGAAELLPLGTHDEVFVGFIPDREDWDDIAEYAKERGCLPFKKGMSVTGRNAELLDNDPARIANGFFVQSLFFPGTSPTIYAGDEIGWKNNWDYAKTQHEKQFKALKEEAGLDVTFDRTFDARWIHRGNMPREAFTEAMDKQYPGAVMVKRLNELRRDRAVIRTGKLHDVSNGNNEVLSGVRESPGERPLLALSNLAYTGKQLRIPVAELRTKMKVPLEVKDKDLKFVDLLGNTPAGKGGSVPLDIQGGDAVLNLDKYDQRLFELRW